MNKHDVALSSCKTINKKKFSISTLKFYKYYFNFFANQNLKYSTKARRQGWIMTLDLDIYKKLDYKIPNYLKVWYGDDWIWYQVRSNKKIAGVFKNYLCGHVKSSSTLAPEIKTIIDKDILAIDKYGEWYKKSTPLIHQYKCKSLKIKHI